MEDKKSLFTVFKSESQKNQMIIDNTILMLSRRIYIDKNGDKNFLLDYDIVKNKITDHGNNTYSFKTNNDIIFTVKILYQKILSTGKQSAIIDFIKEYADDKKIIVATDFSNKAVEFAVKQGVQIFREDQLIIDIMSQKNQPTFELLSPKETEEFKKEYNCSSYTTPKILRQDIITKYYGLKKGDFIKAIYPSPTSGLSLEYRVVS